MMRQDIGTMGITERGFHNRRRKSIIIFLILLVIWACFAVVLLMCGDKNYSLGPVIRAIMGEDIKGVTYAVRTIRIPRVLIGTMAGISFGIAGNTFQKIMRNPLASPDVMGISSGASAVAVFSMMVLHLSGWVVSVLAMAGGIGVATLILTISQRKGFSVNRMILTGIGLQAMLQAVINFVILKTSDYDVSDALRWLSGSLNGVRMKDVYSFGFIMLAAIIVLLALTRELSILCLGDEMPILLGMNTELVRSLLIYGAVVLCAGTTAVTGPLASVAFMSGPIAARILNTGESGSLHAGMIGGVIVLFSETVGQFAFATRYPVGVITGIIGAPYLIYLLGKMNSKSA